MPNLPAAESLMQHHSLDGQPGTCGRLITLDHFHHGKGHILSLLEQTLTLDMALPPCSQCFYQNYHPRTYRMPPQCGRASSNPLKAWIEEKVEWSKRECTLSVFRLRHWSSAAFELKRILELTPLALLGLRPSDSGWNYTVRPTRFSACRL